ncbi:MAG: hypothetical protein ACE5FU_07035, partial [Nitrospinota bacterium]
HNIVHHLSNFLCLPAFVGFLRKLKKTKPPYIASRPRNPTWAKVYTAFVAGFRALFSFLDRKSAEGYSVP